MVAPTNETMASRALATNAALTGKKDRGSTRFGHIMGNSVGNRVLHLSLALVGLFGSSACDIVQGFENAGDALFPPQKTYLEAPGFRLAQGNFHRLNVGIGDELYLLARDARPDAERNLYSMRYVDPKPCKLSGVGRYWSSGLPTDYPAQIVYLENDERRGTLHFADARCNEHPFTLPDAELPFDESSSGLLILSGTSLMLVDPPTGMRKEIATGLQAMYLNGPGAHYLIVDGELRAYTPGTWEPIGSTGQTVIAVRGLGGAFIFEDSTGVHSVTAINPTGTPLLTVRDIDLEGCRIGWISGSMMAYYSPCPEPGTDLSTVPVSLYDASKDKTFHLDYVADPYYFMLELDPEANVLEAKLDEDYWYYTLRTPQEAGGTLVVRSPDGDEFALGQGARLDRTNLDDDGEYGLAILDASGETGRLVRWQPDGTVETIATDVLTSSGDLIVNWNGTVGDRARLDSDGKLEILLERVPRRDYDYQDQSRRWRALFDDSDGITGTLSIDSSGSRTYANKKVIAKNVRHPRHQFLDVVLPGIAYVSNYDLESDTGVLQYNNLELGFKGIVSEGVSDFIPSGNGVLYSVPFGTAAGVWIARAQ
jgi:hypothetical protein